MRTRRNIEYYLVRYIPAALNDSLVNIGVLAVEPDVSKFADAKFISDWSKVTALDPDADVEVLDALRREIQILWCDPNNRTGLLRMMEDSWSNMIQLSDARSCVTEDPAREVERLASLYL